MIAIGFVMRISSSCVQSSAFRNKELVTTGIFSSISIRNLVKIASVYPRSAPLPARFYSAYTLRIGWTNMQWNKNIDGI
jgi:hypothetical protein